MKFHAFSNSAENYVSPITLRCVSFTYMDMPFLTISLFLFIIISFWWGLGKFVLPADTQLLFSLEASDVFLEFVGTISVCLLFWMAR